MKLTFIPTTFFLILLIVACSSPANKCPKAKNEQEQNNQAENGPKIDYSSDQATMNLSSYEAVQYWKKKMNYRLDYIKKIYEKYDWMEPAYKKRFFENLDAAQNAFMASVKAEVELRFPIEEADEWWGSSTPLCINVIYLDHYKRRYDDLAIWVKGTPKGEVCGGTAMTAYEIGEMRKN
jgi:hypothetical protein